MHCVSLSHPLPLDVNFFIVERYSDLEDTKYCGGVLLTHVLYWDMGDKSDCIVRLRYYLSHCEIGNEDEEVVSKSTLGLGNLSMMQSMLVL